MDSPPALSGQSLPSSDLPGRARPGLARGRWSMAAMFFVNGFLLGSWAPQIPVLLARLGIAEFTLGLLLLGFGLGALAAMSLGGALIGRHGSRLFVRLFGTAALLGLPAVVMAPNVATAALALFFFGGAVGGMDVAMNANAVEVERRLGRAVMSSSHGFWSLGGFAGGALGGIVVEGGGALVHASAVATLALGVFAVAQRGLLTEARPTAAAHQSARRGLPRGATLYLLGVMALFAMVSEGAVLDWAALYLKQERGADIATAGFAFAAFSATMALMRFAGDRVRNRLGAVATLRLSALAAAIGLLGGGMAPDAPSAILAFTFAGLGIANVVPVIFSAAGNQPGLAAGAGLGIVTVMGYSGILLAPSAIGFAGQHAGFAPAFIGLAGLLALVYAMAGLARAADGSG